VPALVNKAVGTFSGSSGAEGKRRWPRASKNWRTCGLSDFDSMLIRSGEWLAAQRGTKKARPRSRSEDELRARGTTSFRPTLAGRAWRTAITVLLYNRSAWRALLAGAAFFSHLKGGEHQVPGVRLTPAGY
jgi:hypothetical protein